jgi:uncharacterized C2H2 Zn-finger protein
VNLIDQLRAIADRLEAAEAERAAALDDLWHLRTADSAAVSPVAAEAPGEEPVPISASSPAPIHQAGPPVAQAPAADTTVDSAPPGSLELLGPSSEVICPDCGHAAKNVAGLAIHRGRSHGVKGAKPLVVDGDPTEPNGHDFKKQPILHHGIEWFPCPSCPTKYTTRLRLDEHVARAHREGARDDRRPTIAERVAARDASRARDAARRQARATRAAAAASHR